MRSERQQQLLRRMRRSLISLNMQTPRPVLHRISKRWYFAVLGGLVLLTALLSTRAALLFREEVEATRARVVYVQLANAERRKTRAAALMAYVQSPDPAQKPAPAIEPMSVEKPPALVPVKQLDAVGKKTTQQPAPAPSEIVVSSRFVESPIPASVAEAFARLRRGDDSRALSWLIARPTEYRHSAVWQEFQQEASAEVSALGHFQLGVLFGALGANTRAYRWSASAVKVSAKPHYIRSLAVAADRLGKTTEATRAYRQYLKVATPGEASEVADRLFVLRRK